jgi:general secretion pathway protein K
LEAPAGKSMPTVARRRLRGGVPRLAACAVRRHSAGIALFMVLWVLTLLAVIVGQLSYSVRGELKALRNMKDSAEAYYIAEAGLALATLALLQGSETAGDSDAETSEAVLRVNAPLPIVPYAGGRVGIWVDNSSGQVDLNTADAPLLRLMLGGLNLDEDRMDTIVDAIMDWRDEDEFHRASGAESDYYRSLPEPYYSKNADFDSIEELRLVKGVTEELFDPLRERFTVFTDSASESRQLRKLFRKGAAAEAGHINLNAAHPDVLMALPEMTEERVAAIAEFRQNRDFKSLTEVSDLLGPGVFAEMAPYVSLEMTPYYTIYAEAMVYQSKVRQRIALKIRIDPQNPQGFTVIERIEG